jgi:hypothetical protein
MKNRTYHAVHKYASAIKASSYSDLLEAIFCVSDRSEGSVK